MVERKRMRTFRSADIELRHFLSLLKSRCEMQFTDYTKTELDKLVLGIFLLLKLSSLIKTSFIYKDKSKILNDSVRNINYYNDLSVESEIEEGFINVNALLPLEI